MTAITDNGFARISKETLIRDPNTVGALYGGTIAYNEALTINEKIDDVALEALGGTVTDVSSTSSDATIANSTTTPAITIVSAPKLTNPRNINGVAFDGTGDITISDNTKVVSNAPIIGATKTKITYDSKGLVTSGTDATTADIADSTDKRYVTDANITTIGNQSGTNTGNQTITNTSDATSHTATLSATGGSLKFVEGANITITTTGTSSDGIITIASTGGSGSGDVVGPASSTNNNVATFNGTTGKLIKDSGLTLSGNNTGDQTSIVGITGTKAQFDTAVTDGNIMYIGDAPTAHNQNLSTITDVTMTVANLNSLDDGVNTSLHFHDADRARSAHTGTQASTTISDFTEAAQDAVGGMVDTTLVYSDVTPSIGRAALTGAITASAGSNATALGSFTTAQLNTALSDNDIATGGGTATGSNTGDNAVNSLYSGLVTNATHTGEVTGATALTVDKTVITNKTTITADAADFMLVSDTSDSGNLKKVAVPTGGGSGDMTKSIYDIDNIGLDIFQYARRMALIF